MNKGNYSKDVTRKEFVTKFLERLEKVELKDAVILPAMEDYVNTGDREMFEEYIKFHYAMELKERENFLKKMIERSEKNNSALEKKLEDDKAYADKVYKDFKEYMEKYKSFFNEYKVWRDDIMKELDSDETTISQGWGTLTKLIEENGSVNPRKDIYVTVGKEVKKIDSVTIDNGRIFLHAGNSKITVDEYPKAPVIESYRGRYAITKYTDNYRDIF